MTTIQNESMFLRISYTIPASLQKQPQTAKKIIQSKNIILDCQSRNEMID